MTGNGIIALENEHLSVKWDSARGTLLEITDLRAGLAILDPSVDRGDPSTGLWQLDLDKDTIRPMHAAHLDAALDERALTLCWSGFADRGASLLTVTATIALALDGFVCWRLALAGIPEGWRLDALHFPRLAGLTRVGDEEWLALPIGIGRLVREPRQWLAARDSHSWQGIYPGGLNMQCTALYASSGTGLYLATDDGAAHLKGMAWQWTNDRKRLDYELLNHPSLPIEDGCYEMPYRAVLGTFQGDWLTAAEIYRPWALQQAWSVNSRFRRGLSAPWLRQTGLWMWNRGVSANVVPPAIALSDYVGVPVSVLWHWWHGCAYDTGFPEYLPPREGTEPFQVAVAQLKAYGIHPIPYVNGRLWGTTTHSWTAENARIAAAESRSGDAYHRVYNSFTRLPCAPMCPSTELWQNKLAGLLHEIVQDCGLPGVYLDQVAAMPPAPCHNLRHGHDLSGGNVWSTGYHQLMRRVREQIGPETPIATEGCCEVYMDAFDTFLTLDSSVERYSARTAGDPNSQPIPFFPSVYHGQALLFGSYNSLVNPPYDELWPPALRPSDTLSLIENTYGAQFRLDLARQIVWGLQPMLANFRPEQLETRPSELAFLRRLVRLAVAASKYLRDGTYLRPPVAADLPAMDIPLRTRSIYASNDQETVHVRSVPVIWISAWRAPDGDVALVLVNISDGSTRLVLSPDWQEWGLTGREPRWQLDGEAHRHPLPPIEGEWVLEMPPQGAQIIEWTPKV